MKLSIITVVRNAEKTIEAAIQSVINQSFDDFEYIIIDGCSTDKTKEIIESFSGKINTFVSEADKGIYDAMNKGVDIAEGEWIYFLGADDVVYSNSVFKDIFNNNNHDDADVIYGNVIFKQTNILFDGEFNAEKLCSKSPCHQAVFYRRQLFSIFGKFDIRYFTSADYVLHIKTFCNGARWKYLDYIIAIYDQTGVSTIKRDKIFRNDNFEIRTSNFAGHVNPKSLARVFLSSFWQYFISHHLNKSIKNLKILFSYVNLHTIFSVIYDKYFKK